MAGLSRRRRAKCASMSARRSSAKRQGRGAKRRLRCSIATIGISVIARPSTPPAQRSSFDHALADHDRLAADRRGGKLPALHGDREPDQAGAAHLVALLDVVVM